MVARGKFGSGAKLPALVVVAATVGDIKRARKRGRPYDATGAAFGFGARPADATNRCVSDIVPVQPSGGMTASSLVRLASLRTSL